jgi:hypothetical protein
MKMPTVAEILSARIQCEVDRDGGIARLKEVLREQEKKRKTALNAGPASSLEHLMEHMWRIDLTLGRSTAYYTLEEEALMIDLPRVAAEHNARIVQSEIEKRKQKIARKVAKKFPPLNALPEDERYLAMYLAGVVPPAPKGKVPLPTEAVKYAVVVKQNRKGTDSEPGEEVVEAMEGWKRFYTDEDVKKASIAEAGSIQPGGHLNIRYGSS